MRRTLLSLVFASLLPLAAHAQNSLYDTSRSLRPTTAEASVLGPKSGNIRYDERMIRAAQIAQQRAHKRTTWFCWRYVKDALLAADVITSRPSTAYAKQAGAELSERFGFTKLRIRNPYAAPVGAVIVYGGPDAGHVELRTARGFVSDFVSATPYPRPLLGVYVKRS